MASDDLRERVLAEFAKHEVQHGGRRVEGSEDRWEFPCKCGVILRNGWKSTVDEHVADAVLAVVQPEIADLREQRGAWQGLAHDWQTRSEHASATIERANADYDAAVTERDEALAEVVRLRARLARVERVEALFAGGPDTPCRTTWIDDIECVEIPLDELRAAFRTPDGGSGS